MKDEKEIIQGTPIALREYLRQEMLQISFATKEQVKEYTFILSQCLNIKNGEVRENQIVFNIDNGLVAFEHANRFLLDNQIIYTGIAIIKPTLEDVFIRLTSDPAKEVS